MNEMTYREVIAKNGGKPVEFTVDCGECHSDEKLAGLTVKASCWTDDEEVLDWPAEFDLDSSWRIVDGGISCRDDIDIEIIALSRKISEKFGGEWVVDYCNSVLRQI